MQVESSDQIRNIAVTGHNDTGKTTLVSSFLYTTGVVNRLNRVEDGNAITDFDPEEVERQISIGLGSCYMPWREHKINLIDCPGYGIFFPETRAGIRATDSVLLAISAVSGIEVNTEKIWEFAERVQHAVTVVLTKMDRERANFDERIAELQKDLSRAAVPLQIPIGQESEFRGIVDLVERRAFIFDKDENGTGKKVSIPSDLNDQVETWRDRLIETVAESDDQLMEKYFDSGGLSDEDLRAGLKQAVKTRKLFPVLLSSALHGIGTTPILDAAIDLMPSPVDREHYPAHTIGGEDIQVATDPSGAVSAIVFKTLNDPFSGRLSLLRVVSGHLKADSPIWNANQEKDERLGHLLAIQGKHGTDVSELIMGDIGGVAKLKHSKTGDTLCDKDHPVLLSWVTPREPAIAFAIEPKSKGDEEKIGDALNRLLEEDPTLSAGRDAQTGEYLLSGTGQLHVEIAVAKLKKKFHVEVILHPPKVPYRETIRKPATGHGRHKKQSGGRGQFADCTITMEPLKNGEEFEFLDEIFGGSIPQNYRPAVKKGIQETRQKGFLAGYPVVNFRVHLKDGQYHDVDSSEMAFKIAGSLAFKDAMAKAGPTIMEPILKVEISTSEEFMGDIMSDLAQRRGRPQGMETTEKAQIIKATVPMAEMLNYAPALRAMTQGRSRFHMEFSHYDEAPKAVQQKIIEEVQTGSEDD